MNSQGTGQGAIFDGDNRLVDASNPAIAGSTLVQIYCTGLGPVDITPPTGPRAPVSPAAQNVSPPNVMIGGVFATVQFAGLTPGAIGWYQVNALVPAASAKGDAVEVVFQASNPSNRVAMAVR